MANYLKIQASLQTYLASLPAGAPITHHTKSTANGHYLIWQFGKEPVLQDSKPVHIKQEPMEMPADIKPVYIKQEPMEIDVKAVIKQEIDVKPVIKQEIDVKPVIKQEIDVKPVIKQEIAVKTELKEEYVQSTSLLKEETSRPNVFSRLGVKPDLEQNSSGKTRRNRRHRRANKKNSNKASSDYVEDLRTYLKAKSHSAPLDLRQILPKRIPVMSESTHSCFHRLVSGSYYR